MGNVIKAITKPITDLVSGVGSLFSGPDLPKPEPLPQPVQTVGTVKEESETAKRAAEETRRKLAALTKGASGITSQRPLVSSSGLKKNLG